MNQQDAPRINHNQARGEHAINQARGEHAINQARGGWGRGGMILKEASDIACWTRQALGNLAARRELVSEFLTFFG